MSHFGREMCSGIGKGNVFFFKLGKMMKNWGVSSATLGYQYSWGDQSTMCGSRGILGQKCPFPMIQSSSASVRSAKLEEETRT